MIDPSPISSNGQPSYPARPSHFAHRFCRLLTKSAAAQDVGPEACWLLTIIAHQEDAKRYRGPVLYWNEQLMALCGFGGRNRLNIARHKAIAAGWLHYEAGGKGKAGQYWVTIPAELDGTPDAPCDENPAEYRSDLERKADGEPDGEDVCRSKTERKSDGKRDGNREASGRHSTLCPDPDPPLSRRRAPSTAKTGELRTADEAELVDRWNALPDVSHVRELTGKRRAAFRARLAEPVFRAGWREALDKIAASDFCRGLVDGKNWRATLDWFLRPDNAMKLLEGQYDNRSASSGKFDGIDEWLQRKESDNEA